MKIKFIIDDKGNILPAGQFIKREASGWRGTLWNATKECAGTGKTFLKECEQSTRNAISEIDGSKRKKRR